MAASAWKVYNEAKKCLLTGDIDLNAVTLVMKWVASASAALVSDFTKSLWADTGTGMAWKAGSTRHALDSVTVASGASAKVIRLDAADEIFTASTAAAVTGARYLVIGVSCGKSLCWSKLSAARRSLLVILRRSSSMPVGFSSCPVG